MRLAVQQAGAPRYRHIAMTTALTIPSGSRSSPQSSAAEIFGRRSVQHALQPIMDEIHRRSLENLVDFLQRSALTRTASRLRAQVRLICPSIAAAPHEGDDPALMRSTPTSTHPPRQRRGLSFGLVFRPRAADGARSFHSAVPAARRDTLFVQHVCGLRIAVRSP